MTIAEARAAYDQAMNQAAQAASRGRFDAASAFLNLAAMHWRRLDAMKTAIETMKGTNQ
jgi:hypothetical protein